VNIVDVESVAAAHVVAAAKTPHARYTLAGNTVRVRELLERTARRFGGVMPPLELPAEEARVRATEEERAAAPKKERVTIPRELVDMATTGQQVSDARAKAELGFAPLPLDEALDRSHAWLSRFGFVPKPGKEGPTHGHT
jgi:dihydroflavonol-4-reductase